MGCPPDWWLGKLYRKRRFIKAEKRHGSAAPLVAASVVSVLLLMGTPSFAASSEADVAAISSLNAGTAALQSGRSLEAVEYLNDAIESGALSAEGMALAYHHRGIAHQKLNLTGHAVADYTNAIWQGGLPPNVLPRSYYNRAVAYAQMGQQDRAEQDYNKTIELQPDYAAAYHNRGNLRRNLGRHTEAVADYSRALELGMADGAHLTYFARALSNRELGAAAEAVRDAEQALSVKPDFPVARAALTEWGPAPIVAAAPRQESGNEDVVSPIVTASLPAPRAASSPPQPVPAAVEQVRAPSQPPVSPVRTQISGANEASKPLTLVPPQVAAIEPQTGNVTVTPLAEALPPSREADGWTATVTRFASPPAASSAHVGEIMNDGHTRSRAAVPARDERLSETSLVTASIDPSATLPAVNPSVGSNARNRAQVIQPVQLAQNGTPAANDAGAGGAATGARIQVGSFRSAVDATNAWDKIARKHGASIGQRQPYIAEADLGARGIYYRLQIGGFRSADEAKALCSSLKAAGQDCIIAR